MCIEVKSFEFMFPNCTFSNGGLSLNVIFEIAPGLPHWERRGLGLSQSHRIHRTQAGGRAWQAVLTTSHHAIHINKGGLTTI
jgi:hypothetical protein